MRVSELIERLNGLYWNFGDLEVKAEMNCDGKVFDVENAVPEYIRGDIRRITIYGSCEQEMPECDIFRSSHARRAGL